MNKFETIGCKNGGVIAACNIDYTNEVNWLLEKTYYISQGCVVNTVEEVVWGNPCICEHHNKLLHHTEEFENKVTEMLSKKFLS